MPNRPEAGDLYLEELVGLSGAVFLLTQRCCLPWRLLRGLGRQVATLSWIPPPVLSARPVSLLFPPC